MKGLDLALGYYTDVILPAFSTRFPDVLDNLAFGLVGPGSECYGFDDVVSRDHDWGPRVCIWLPEALYQNDGMVLQETYDGLPPVYKGFGPICHLDTRMRRDGVLSIERFYRSYLGTAECPVTNRDWLVVPEESLSVCTNGMVFSDSNGQFSAMRQRLLAYYPRDIVIKKMACRLKDAGQSGQYNLWRSMRREDVLASAYFKQQFLIEAASIVYILHHTFRPFKKWLFRGLRNFGDVGSAFIECFESLQGADDDKALKKAVSKTVDLLVESIAQFDAGIANKDSLYDSGVALENSLADRELREDLYTIE